jgi:perosamine synthetase
MWLCNGKGGNDMISIAKPIMEDSEISAVLEVLRSGQLACGPKVREFEEKFAEWCQTKYAVATTSGTTSLHVALLANEIEPGDEVITTPFSFIASANCVLHAGARPVFADIESDYFTIDPREVEKQITGKTRAIIPVHLYGQMCEMEAITRIAQEHNLIIIQDACQAHGASYKGLPIGAYGTGCYSFYATKNMTTIEGGMVTTNDPKVAERARLIRDHGNTGRYNHIAFGYNFLTTDLQAAIGLSQLKKVDGWNKKRQQNAAFLSSRLSKIDGIVVPKIREGAEHVFHQYTIRIQDRDNVAQKLREKGVGCGIHYPLPIPQQPFYRGLGYSDQLPITEAACKEVLSLPVHPSVTEENLEYIVQSIAELYDGANKVH